MPKLMPEPLHTVVGEIVDANGNDVIEAINKDIYFVHPVKARRIVAAVNACAGIPIEDLENDAVTRPFFPGWHSMPRQEQRRVAACFEACKGIPTEALEAGVVGEMVEAAEGILPLADIGVRHSPYPSSPPLTRLMKALDRAKAKGESP